MSPDETAAIRCIRRIAARHDRKPGTRDALLRIAEAAEFEGKLTEIRRLLAEAYEHYFANSDGHCKSSEGAMSIHYSPFFWRAENAGEVSVAIYSYVLGPSRQHQFRSVDKALEAVREWHAAEMAATYDEEWGVGCIASMCPIIGPHPSDHDWPMPRCHCGEYVAYGFDGDITHHRGMCSHCDSVRCDVEPGACRP